MVSHCSLREILHVSHITFIYIIYAFFIVFVLKWESKLMNYFTKIKLHDPESFKYNTKWDDFVILITIILKFISVSILYLVGKDIISNNEILLSPVQRCGQSLGSRNGVIITTFFLYASLGDLKNAVTYLINKYL
jgi:hypothetical protein